MLICCWHWLACVWAGGRLRASVHMPRQSGKTKATARNQGERAGGRASSCRSRVLKSPSKRIAKDDDDDGTTWATFALARGADASAVAQTKLFATNLRGRRAADALRERELAPAAGRRAEGKPLRALPPSDCHCHFETCGGCSSRTGSKPSQPVHWICHAHLLAPPSRHAELRSRRRWGQSLCSAALAKCRRQVTSPPPGPSDCLGGSGTSRAHYSNLLLSNRLNLPAP